jgi:lipoprotein-releasing system permease protein
MNIQQPTAPAPPAQKREAPPKPRSTYPFSAFEWMIAFRYLRPKRKEAFISVIAGFSLLGIGLGVAALIIVMSVMNGFRSELLGRILGLNGHMIVQSVTGGIPNYDALAQRIRAIPGIASATPIIEGQVMVSVDNVVFGGLVRGIRKSDLPNLKSVYESLTPRAIQEFGDSEAVILGQRLADRLGLLPGMSVTLIAPRGQVTPFGMTPRIKSYRVAGTFEVGMSEYDQTFIFMPLEEAQLYFGMEGAAGGIELMAANPDQVAMLRDEVARVAGPTTRTLTWQDMNTTLFGALQVERNVMFLILTIIILVAAFNIISSLIMMVKDKSGDIAIMRTMGATRGAVMRVFFIAGATIGIVGTLAGLVIGIVFCENIEALRQFVSRLSGTEVFDPTIYFLTQMPAEIDPMEVALVVTIALGLSFLATIYPSWRAARLDPVEALRYE